MDAYLSPEMKSTGEAIGYDRSLKRALYKALQASGVKVKEYGTVVVTLADEDKEEALPLVRRFYELILVRSPLSVTVWRSGRCAIMNGVTMFTSLDTVRILLDVLEDITPRIADDLRSCGSAETEEQS